MKITVTLMFALSFLLACSAHAYADDEALASCVALDGTAGASIFTDGTDVYLQVAKIDESVDEYRTDAGVAPSTPVDLDAVRAAIAFGQPLTLSFTKDTSTAVSGGGITTDAALLSLIVHPTPDGAPADSLIAYRGRIMAVACSLPPQ